MRLTQAEDLPVTAVHKPRRIIDDPCGDRVEVNVRHHLSKVLVGGDDPGPVPALPKPAKVTVLPIEISRNRGLEARHGPPQLDLSGCEDKVIVIPHEAPRENRPSIKIAHSAKDFDEFDGLFVIVKHELSAGNTAVHMIGRTGNK